LFNSLRYNIARNRAVRYRFSPRGAISILPRTCTYRYWRENRGVERKCKLREFRLLLCKSTFRPRPPKI